MSVFSFCKIVAKYFFVSVNWDSQLNGTGESSFIDGCTFLITSSEEEYHKRKDIL